MASQLVHPSTLQLYKQLCLLHSLQLLPHVSSPAPPALFMGQKSKELSRPFALAADIGMLLRSHEILQLL